MNGEVIIELIKSKFPDGLVCDVPGIFPVGCEYCPLFIYGDGNNPGCVLDYIFK